MSPTKGLYGTYVYKNHCKNRYTYIRLSPYKIATKILTNSKAYYAKHLYE